MEVYWKQVKTERPDRLRDQKANLGYKNEYAFKGLVLA